MSIKCPFCGKSLDEHQVEGELLGMQVVLCDKAHMIESYIKDEKGNRYAVVNHYECFALSTEKDAVVVCSEITDSSVKKIGGIGEVNAK